MEVQTTNDASGCILDNINKKTDNTISNQCMALMYCTTKKQVLENIAKGRKTFLRRRWINSKEKVTGHCRCDRKNHSASNSVYCSLHLKMFNKQNKNLLNYSIVEENPEFEEASIEDPWLKIAKKKLNKFSKNISSDYIRKINSILDSPEEKNFLIAIDDFVSKLSCKQSVILDVPTDSSDSESSDSESENQQKNNKLETLILLIVPIPKKLRPIMNFKLKMEVALLRSRKQRQSEKQSRS